MVHIAHPAPLLAQAGGVCRTPVLQQGAAGADALVQLILQRAAIVLLYSLPVPVVLVTVQGAVRKSNAGDAVQNIVAKGGHGTGTLASPLYPKEFCVHFIVTRHLHMVCDTQR